jgi:hypothetical protein
MNNTALVHLSYEDYKDHISFIENLASEIREDFKLNVDSSKYLKVVKGFWSSKETLDKEEIPKDLKSPYTFVKMYHGCCDEEVIIEASTRGYCILKLDSSFQTRRDLWIDVYLYNTFTALLEKEDE